MPEQEVKTTEQVAEEVKTQEALGDTVSPAEETTEAVPEEGSAEQYQAMAKDIDERKAGFRQDLYDLVEKWKIAPDAHGVYSQHGIKFGVVLIDLKYGGNIDETVPTFEEEMKMREVIQNMVASDTK